jgi:hypothetical protein
VYPLSTVGVYILHRFPNSSQGPSLAFFVVSNNVIILSVYVRFLHLVQRIHGRTLLKQCAAWYDCRLPDFHGHRGHLFLRAPVYVVDFSVEYLVYNINCMANGANMVWKYVSFIQTSGVVSPILRPYPHDNIRGA